MTQPTVTQALSYILRTAWKNHSDLHAKWTQISIIVGSKLPNSQLMLSVQQLGHLDILIREVEKEFAIIMKGSIEFDIYANQLFVILSENWVCNAYHILQTLRSRQLIANEEFAEIYNYSRLIRIILEKHLLAKDWNLEQPLTLRPIPVPGCDTTTETFTYLARDKRRNNNQGSFITPRGVSLSGSFMWYVLDIENANNIKELWIERQYLSNRIISFFMGEKFISSSEEASE